MCIYQIICSADRVARLFLSERLSPPPGGASIVLQETGLRLEEWWEMFKKVSAEMVELQALTANRLAIKDHFLPIIFPSLI